MPGNLNAVLLLLAALTTGTTANAGSPATPPGMRPEPASAVRPVASFQEIMLAEVVLSAEGVVEHRPTTDEEWPDLRHQALIYIGFYA